MTPALGRGVPCHQCPLLVRTTAVLQLDPRYLWSVDWTATTKHWTLSRYMTLALVRGVPWPQCLLCVEAPAVLQLDPRYLWLVERTATRTHWTLLKCTIVALTCGVQHLQRTILGRLA